MQHEPVNQVHLNGDAHWSGAYQRARRHRRESAKARQRLLCLLAADHRLRFLGTDQLVVHVAAALGFESHDLLAARAIVGSGHATFVIVPRRLWHHQKALLRSLKAQARAMGIRAVLVPERQLARQPRLGVAERIASSALAVVTPAERQALECHLHEQGVLTLSECVALLPDNPDPIAAMLSMVRARKARLALDRPIDLTSSVFVV